VVPEGLYNALIKVVDLLQKLDNLKDMKACLNNDFSRYKRLVHESYEVVPMLFEQSIHFSSVGRFEHRTVRRAATATSHYPRGSTRAANVSRKSTGT
jgi:hypothetical protein